MVRNLQVIAWILALVGIVYLFEMSSVQAIDIQTLVRISICGDGLTQEGAEVCDEGPGGNLGGYGSSTAQRTCAPGCETFGPYCGDGTLQVRFIEQCDDGNESNGDICSTSCTPIAAVPTGSSGSPTVGSTPQVPGGVPGTIPSVTETRVVLRGKAYPRSMINILLDGQIMDTIQADANANFIYSTSAISPGTATFGFSSKDANGTDSITTSVVFEVVQSAVTTVANVFFPPTIRVSSTQLTPGDPFTLSGQTVPGAKVVTEIRPGKVTILESAADPFGMWALQVDSNSIPDGTHSAKSYFEESKTVRSGFGKSVSFVIGVPTSPSAKSPDLNKDGKVNLVDFSIFLISWNTNNDPADFNSDGRVNLADFSIMLFNWTG